MDGKDYASDSKNGRKIIKWIHNQIRIADIICTFKKVKWKSAGRLGENNFL